MRPLNVVSLRLYVTKLHLLMHIHLWLQPVRVWS